MADPLIVVPEPEVAAGIPGIAARPEGPGDVVLARPLEVAPAAAAALAAARAVGADIVLLPVGADLARWVAAVGARWAAEREELLHRALEALVSMLPAGCGVPMRLWGAGDVPVPALPLPTLARLARRAWVPCGVCAGGGVRGGCCGRCGLQIEAAA